MGVDRRTDLRQFNRLLELQLSIPQSDQRIQRMCWLCQHILASQGKPRIRGTLETGNKRNSKISL